LENVLIRRTMFRIHDLKGLHATTSHTNYTNYATLHVRFMLIFNIKKYHIFRYDEKQI
jgi:hypothetical protein